MVTEATGTATSAGSGAITDGGVLGRIGPERIDRLHDFLAPGGGEADSFEVHAPATGERLATVPVSAPADVAAAFDRARDAQASWARTPMARRVEVLSRLHDLVFDRAESILDLIQAESGKARRHAFEELCDVPLTARYYARVGPGVLRPQRRAGLVPGLTQVHELRQPKGVVGVISPWNYPFTLAISDGLPALLAGNAVVTKPASETPLCGLLGAELLADAGLPDGLWQVVTGPGDPVGTAVIDQADYMCFTGSTAVGRRVAARCGERLIGCSLELGGKNPALVLGDAVPDAAAELAVRGCFSNAGQLCISLERVYVAESIHDEFLERFTRRVRGMRVGASFDFRPDMGSLISKRQLDTVTSHVTDAVEHGAEALAGGRARPDLGPYFFEPTVLSGVRPPMRCYAEETFGPVVAVYPVADDAEAIERANDSAYGLNAAVYGRDVRRARSVAARLQAGTVNINESYTTTWGSTDAPMGGVGASGLGRRHGLEGITKYTEPKSIAAQRVHPIRPPPLVPYPAFAKGMTTALKLLRRMGRK